MHHFSAMCNTAPLHQVIVPVQVQLCLLIDEQCKIVLNFFPIQRAGIRRHAGLLVAVADYAHTIMLYGLIVFGKCRITARSRGEVNHWDGTNLKQRLEEELGDLLAAIHFVIDKNLTLSTGEIGHRQGEKRRLFEKWHEESKIP